MIWKRTVFGKKSFEIRSISWFLLIKLDQTYFYIQLRVQIFAIVSFG